jgi:hypothetical protein
MAYSTEPEDLDPLKNPWDRQPRETSKAFAAFGDYLALDPSKRRLAEAARVHGKSEGTLARWCRRWRWVERALAWDDHVAREAREAELQAVRDMREREINFGQAMQALGGAKISELAEAIEKGQPVTLTVNEARMLIDIGMKLERRGRGEPEQHVAHDHRWDHIDTEALSDEQIRRMLNGESPEQVLGEAEVH